MPKIEKTVKILKVPTTMWNHALPFSRGSARERTSTMMIRKM